MSAALESWRLLEIAASSRKMSSIARGAVAAACLACLTCLACSSGMGERWRSEDAAGPGPPGAVKHP